MKTYDILLAKWNDFHKDRCKELLYHEVFNNYNIKEALKENVNYNCQIKEIDEKIKLDLEAKFHILSFKLSDDRKLKIVNQILKDNHNLEIYMDIFYTNEKNVYEVLMIEF